MREYVILTTKAVYTVEAEGPNAALLIFQSQYKDATVVAISDYLSPDAKNKIRWGGHLNAVETIIPPPTKTELKRTTRRYNTDPA